MEYDHGPASWGRGYDCFMRPLEWLGLTSWRRLLLQNVIPPVLEVGIGTGVSLSRYGDVLLTAIEPSAGMMQAANRRASRLRLDVHLAQMDVQHLAFPSAGSPGFEGFATVVASLVFCSVPKPSLGLLEIKRVLRPGGTLLMLEHVRPSHPLLGAITDWANVPWKVLSRSCELNRKTAASVAAAGFELLTVEKRLGGLVNHVVARRRQRGDD